MTDDTAFERLVSDVPLVVAEAPAGCGKTHQGAECAAHYASSTQGGRVLVLTHTHAAANVFSDRLSTHSERVEVRTIDSLIHEVAKVYHLSLGLPAEPGMWARSTTDGYARMAQLVRRLLAASPMVGDALSRRYPVVVCDEHQDASSDQESVVESLRLGGSRIRMFGDPMQAIFDSSGGADFERRWSTLERRADLLVRLDTPHRWRDSCPALGEWILRARSALSDGGQVDLGRTPAEVEVVRFKDENTRFGGFRPAKADARPFWKALEGNSPVLFLTPYNKTTEGIRAYFSRRLIIWEGHTRDSLDTLVTAATAADGDAEAVCQCLLEFLQGTTTGFSPSKYGNRLQQEVREECSNKARGRVPPALQQVARSLLERPDHCGLARALELVRGLDVFADVKVDYPREFRDAIQLGGFEDPAEGIAEISRRRSRSPSPMPSHSVGTIHKAKGLESDRVVVLPCDERNFPDNEKSRRLLYVAISRATQKLLIAVPRDGASPLLRV